MFRRSHLRRTPEHKYPLLLLRDVHWAFTCAIPILMPNPTLCAFRRPVHSHLRRAREGPEQVPHVLEFARVLLGHGADVKAQHDNDRCTPLLSSLAR